MAAILDALGVERFATYGTLGRRPARARLRARCSATAARRRRRSPASAPADAPDLDFLAGMGEGNIAEFGAAREGRERARPSSAAADAAGLADGDAEQLADAMRPHLSDVDAAALTGELAEHLLAAIVEGARARRRGLGRRRLRVPRAVGLRRRRDRGARCSIWQGEQDLMVPAGPRPPGCASTSPAPRASILPGEGHLTLFVNRVADVHAWLAERLG